MTNHVTSIPLVKDPVVENSESRTLENLDKYKKYGESIRRELKLLKQNQSAPSNEILNNSQLRDCLKKIEESANKTFELASSPVKIAVMGEFSSGKTLLIGNLIGYADALPVNNIPTTGNVTAIHLFQQEEFKTTEFDDFIVEYLSGEEVQECFGYMLEKAIQEVEGSRC